MADTESALSRSMEDYLEAIYNLEIRTQAARVKDIARELAVKMPSVTGAIRSLAEKGLVKHQPYETVELTQEGLRRAKAVAQRHSAVKEFLTSVLGLSDGDAEQEACGIEHAIRPDTLDKLLRFVEFVRTSDDGAPLSLDDVRHFIQHGSYRTTQDPPICVGGHRHRRGRQATPTGTAMNELSPGARGRIALVCGRGPIRKRLLEMGLTPDTEFEVVRAAPFGDPIEIKIRGYNLSLRKSEAAHIEVEVE